MKSNTCLSSRALAPGARMIILPLIALAAPGLRAAAPKIQAPSGNSSLEVADFGTGWKFSKGDHPGAENPAFDDTSWREVVVPHDWSIEDLEPLPPEPVPSLHITKGTWRFAKGDDMQWKEPGFDDSSWASVELPKPWEEHSNYKDPASYGWLRRKFDIPAACKGREFRLAVGWVKDADETYVNGTLVGKTGQFPPEFRGAETVDRHYPVPPALVKGDGTDVVAVRVYLHAGYGGGIFREQMPHTRSGPFDTEAPNGPSVGFTLGGTAWYRKTFRLPPGPADRLVRVEFGGIYQDSEVWINGRHLGRQPYGYTSFGHDLTPHLRPGDSNVIAVRARNEGNNSRWYAGSGIFRPVRLILTGPVRVAPHGLFVTTPEVSKTRALVRVSTTVANARQSVAQAKLRTQAVAPDGQVAAQTETSVDIPANGSAESVQSLEIRQPALWSAEQPALHNLVTEVVVDGTVVDRASTRFGIRSIAFDAKNGFRLNGVAMKLRGSCMHHDNGPLGAAAWPDAEHRRVRLTKQAGFNAIRCSHNPPSEAFLDACDELGVLVIDEAFDTWGQGKGGSDFYAKHFNEWWQRDLEAMVLRDRNHPSVIMWSIGNEIPANDTDPVFQTARTLANHVKQLDPSRPVTSGVQGVNPKKDGFFAALDVAGYNYALTWNEGHTYQKTAYVDDHQRHPQRVIYGAESFASRAFDYWMQAVDHPWVIGDFVWTGWDYLGESSIGWIGFGYPVYWPQAYCGDISITGQRRPQSYYRGALFGTTKLAAFVQRPQPSFEHTRRYEWGFEDVQASWTWPGHEGKHLGIVVYSSCDEVELFLNGKSLGRRPTTREQQFRAGYGVNYEPGTLLAVGYENGRKTSESKLETAGPPATVRLLPETSEIAADGKSLAFIPFEIVDAKGTVHPEAANLVRFSVDGPATLAAVGSDDPSSLESFQQPSRKAWRGRGLAILRSTGKPGKITLTATSDSLATGTAAIDAK